MTAALSTPASSGNHATTNVPSAIARGVLEAIIPATATKPTYIVFAVPGSNYKLHLIPSPELEAIQTAVGKKTAGVINVQARRVDIVPSGGRLVEPVIGRPRRVHGTVIAVDPAAGTITVNAGGSAGVDAGPLPIVAKLTDSRQRPDQFQIGTLVAFDVLEGATFTPLR